MVTWDTELWKGTENQSHPYPHNPYPEDHALSIGQDSNPPLTSWMASSTTSLCIPHRRARPSFREWQH